MQAESPAALEGPEEVQGAAAGRAGELKAELDRRWAGVPATTESQRVYRVPKSPTAPGCAMRGVRRQHAPDGARRRRHAGGALAAGHRDGYGMGGGSGVPVSPDTR
eukprot:TRINITY_DN18477_c0_g2_i1.p2 TRINITY_DN18477_c0_g2~~TRINITY_DN18477_c0_g2_i1.p2  ORF type:complete len:106 (+),score=13.27 TRINITY_DN18477_c0_g2_i1:101-418(+)